MKKSNPKKLTPDWSLIQNRPIYHFLTSAELAKVLGVPLTSINNWVVRNILPAPVPRTKKLKGNKNYFKISAIKAYLQDEPEVELYRELLALEYGWKVVLDEEAEHAMKVLYENPYLDIHNE